MVHFYNSGNLYDVYQGYGVKGFQIGIFTLFLIRNMTTIYVLSIIIDKMSQSTMDMIIVRFQKYKKWIEYLETELLRICFFPIIIWMFTALLTMLCLNSHRLVEVELNSMMILNILFLMEILFLIYFYLTVFVISKSATISFIIVFMLHFIVTIENSGIIYLPIGISSYYRTVDFFSDITGSISAIICFIAILIFRRLFLTKGRRLFVEK